MYKPGDLVWLQVLSGEIPAVITRVCEEMSLCKEHKLPAYELDVRELATIACEILIRPRRDDYQQHEKLGSVETVRSLMKKRRCDSGECMRKHIDCLILFFNRIRRTHWRRWLRAITGQKCVGCGKPVWKLILLGGCK